MISIILVIIAAICNAIMDIVTHKFPWSIFYKHHTIFKPEWWDGRDSWKNKYIKGKPYYGRVRWIFNMKYPVQLTDAWHFFKMLMIFSLVGAIVYFEPPYILFKELLYLDKLLWFIILGVIWNFTFNLFYNKLLRD